MLQNFKHCWARHVDRCASRILLLTIFRAWFAATADGGIIVKLVFRYWRRYAVTEARERARLYVKSRRPRRNAGPTLPQDVLDLGWEEHCEQIALCRSFGLSEAFGSYSTRREHLGLQWRQRTEEEIRGRFPSGQ